MGAHVIPITALFTSVFLQGWCLFPVRLVFVSHLVDLTLVLHIAAWCHQAPQLIASPQPGHKDFQVPSRWGDNSLSDRLLTGSIWFIFSLANVQVAANRLLYLKCAIRSPSHESLLLNHAPPLGMRSLLELSPLSSVQ